MLGFHLGAPLLTLSTSLLQYRELNISMTIKLDQDIMVTNMCLKFGEDWTNSFQELDRKQSSGRIFQVFFCK